MKLVTKTLHYICRSNEEPGMWTERIVSDIANVKFLSKRKYITTENYPLHLKKDISLSLKPVFDQLKINQHFGHKNYYYDFKTECDKSVSIKTNINGNKICPQTIGQTTLDKFNEITKKNFVNEEAYKDAVLNDTQNIINLYLNYLFCCENLLSFKYDKGSVYYFKKNVSDASVTMKEPQTFYYTKDKNTWNNSMTLSININDIVRPLCEFQLHKTRNCIKCRFNLDSLVLMIQNDILQNINVEEYKLRYKYNIKVSKELESF